ncbi:hypothetical protein KO516_08145 [Citreicella sp. C3M06]|uniref:hypothetical protein n=1 Tax=Citreicella sp. C3M06 TaxID=2841564 RepID=UPI001C086F9F|nr:hypothetical protein [Citreicella sp. C3M06]MBU2960785.1 hypothetical protein [Citreicella sp. C3M06]
MGPDHDDRRFRRGLSVALPTALVFLTVAFGIAGWSGVHRDAAGAPMWGHVLYNTIPAFFGDGSYLPGPANAAADNPWIQTARFTGLAATISALLAIVATLLRDTLTRMLAGFRRAHTVVVGVSDFAVDHAAHTARTTAFDTTEKLERQSANRSDLRVLRIPDGMRGGTATGWSLGRPARIVFGDRNSMINVERARNWLGTTKAPAAGTCA